MEVTGWSGNPAAGDIFQAAENEAKAREIARDHLEEFPNYYTELDKMEEKLKEQKKVATVLTLMKAADGAGGDEEAGKEEEEEHSPSKPLPPEIKAKIVEYLRTHNIKHDRDFHEFVESLGDCRAPPGCASIGACPTPKNSSTTGMTTSCRWRKRRPR